jgi:ribosomal protein S18 acetylase RimI-like enzyme
MINIINYSGPSVRRSSIDQALSLVGNNFVHMTDYYPFFYSWLKQKCRPGLMSGERSIVIAARGSRIAGFAILKNTYCERKICTFFVDKNYRRNGIGNMLMSECVSAFSDKPIITVTESLVDHYSQLLTKFEFGRPFVLFSAYKKNVAEYMYGLSNKVVPSERNGLYLLD